MKIISDYVGANLVFALPVDAKTIGEHEVPPTLEVQTQGLPLHAIALRAVVFPAPVLHFCSTSAYNMIMAVSLKEAELTVDALEPRDQIQLVQYLVSRLAEAALANERPIAAQAWEEFRRVAEQVAAAPATESATQLISDMRR